MVLQKMPSREARKNAQRLSLDPPAASAPKHARTLLPLLESCIFCSPPGWAQRWLGAWRGGHQARGVEQQRRNLLLPLQISFTCQYQRLRLPCSPRTRGLSPPHPPTNDCA